MTAVETRARSARQAASAIATLTTATKNAVLVDLAGRIERARAVILQANEADLHEAQRAGLADAKRRRLAIGEAGIAQMAIGLRQVAALPDPVGQVTREYVVPSGLAVRKVRSPIGVILMIYEARPNVTVDAFALCFKAGNACLLKGGREARRSNEALADLAGAAMAAGGAPTAALSLLTTSDRDEMKTLLGLDQHVDLVIPRGGAELIRFVHEHSRIPTVQHFQGVCHIFVDESADLDRALEICLDAKTAAPATCNAAETVLVHEGIAAAWLPRLVDRMTAAGVEIRGDPTVCRLCPRAVAAVADDWGREFLDLILAVRVVPGVGAAIEHIHRHGSNHTDVILSENPAAQQEFLDRVQSSCTLVNASTRFNDGFQLGLGAEIGISTSKIHAYGPMGLEELTTQRYVVRGRGQVRA